LEGEGVVRHKNNSTDLITAQRWSRSVCSATWDTAVS